ncbi:hypothetical protein CP061683_0985A, partial [Chlamydia psittaci 06-1683]
MQIIQKRPCIFIKDSLAQSPAHILMFNNTLFSLCENEC